MVVLCESNTQWFFAKARSDHGFGGRFGGARQAGIVVLRLALDALTDHYEKSKRIGQSIVNAGEVTSLKK